MRYSKAMSRVAVCCALLGGSIAAPSVGAADDSPRLPAVDGVNGSVSGFAGAGDGLEFYGGGGKVAFPLGSSFGLQVDGVVAGADSDFLGDVTVAGTAAHLFWRDPAQGLLGLYGHYGYFDVLDGAEIYAAGLEGALYLGRFTLEGVAGVEGGEVDTNAGSFDLDTRFFDMARLAYYPDDNLKLSLGHNYIFGSHAGSLDAEWGFGAGGGAMVSLFASGSVSEHGDGAALAGLRLYFGQSEKTLIRRHREDDPNVGIANTGSFNIGFGNSGSGNIGFFNSGTNNWGVFNSGSSCTGIACNGPGN